MAAFKGGSLVMGKSQSRITEDFDSPSKTVSALANLNERPRPVKRVSWKDEIESPRSPSRDHPTTPTSHDHSDESSTTPDDASPFEPPLLQSACSQPTALGSGRARLHSVDYANCDLNRQRNSLAVGDSRFMSDTSSTAVELESKRGRECRDFDFNDYTCSSRGCSRVSVCDGNAAYDNLSDEVYPSTYIPRRRGTYEISNNSFYKEEKDKSFCRDTNSKRSVRGATKNSRKALVKSGVSAVNLSSSSTEHSNYCCRLRNNDTSLSVEDFSVDESDTSSSHEDYFQKEHGQKTHVEETRIGCFAGGREYRNSFDRTTGTCDIIKDEIRGAYYRHSPSSCALSGACIADSMMSFSRNGERGVSSDASTGSKNEANTPHGKICGESVNNCMTSDGSVDTESEEDDTVVSNKRRHDQSTPQTQPEKEEDAGTTEDDYELCGVGSISSEDASDAEARGEEKTQQSEDNLNTDGEADESAEEHILAEDFSDAEDPDIETRSSDNLGSSDGVEVEEDVTRLGSGAPKTFNGRRTYTADACKGVSFVYCSDSDPYDGDNDISSAGDFNAEETVPVEDAATFGEELSHIIDSFEEEEEWLPGTVSGEGNDHVEDEGHIFSDGVFADDEGAGVTSSEDYTDAEEANEFYSDNNVAEERARATSSDDNVMVAGPRATSSEDNVMVAGPRATSSEDNVMVAVPRATLSDLGAVQGGMRAISPEINAVEEDSKSSSDDNLTEGGSRVTSSEDKVMKEVKAKPPQDGVIEEDDTAMLSEDIAGAEEKRVTSSEGTWAEKGVSVHVMSSDAQAEKLSLSSSENNAAAEDNIMTPYHASNAEEVDASEDSTNTTETLHQKNEHERRVTATDINVCSPYTHVSGVGKKEMSPVAYKLENSLSENDDDVTLLNDDYARCVTENSIHSPDTNRSETEDIIKHTEKIFAHAHTEHTEEDTAERWSDGNICKEDQPENKALSDKVPRVAPADSGSTKESEVHMIVKAKLSGHNTTVNAVFKGAGTTAKKSRPQHVLTEREDSGFDKIFHAKQVASAANALNVDHTAPHTKPFTAGVPRLPDKDKQCDFAAARQGPSRNTSQVISATSEENKNTCTLTVEDDTVKVALSRTGKLQSKVALTVHLKEGTRSVTTTATWTETTTFVHPKSSHKISSEPTRQRQIIPAHTEAKPTVLSTTWRQKNNAFTQTPDSHPVPSKAPQRQNTFAVTRPGTNEDCSATPHTLKNTLTIKVDTGKASPAMSAYKKSLNNNVTFETDNGEHVCEKCGNCYLRREHLLAHIGEHPVRDLHLGMRCGGCGAQFVSSRALEHHVHLNRMSQAAFRCHRCLRQFRHCDDLYRHSQSSWQAKSDVSSARGIWSILGSTGFVVGKERDVFLRPN